MDLIKKENSKKLKGALLGATLPVILLLIIGLYGYFVSRPMMFDDKTKFAMAPSTYIGVIWIYITSISYYQAFFSLSINMAAVWLLSNKTQNSIANGVIIPTAIYAVILVAVRLI